MRKCIPDPTAVTDKKMLIKAAFERFHPVSACCPQFSLLPNLSYIFGNHYFFSAFPLEFGAKRTKNNVLLNDKMNWTCLWQSYMDHNHQQQWKDKGKMLDWDRMFIYLFGPLQYILENSFFLPGRKLKRHGLRLAERLSGNHLVGGSILRQETDPTLKCDELISYQLKVSPKCQIWPVLNILS